MDESLSQRKALPQNRGSVPVLGRHRPQTVVICALRLLRHRLRGEHRAEQMGGVWQDTFLPCRSFEVRAFHWRGDEFQGMICTGVIPQDEMTGGNEGLMEKMRESEGESLKKQELNFPTLWLA